MFVKNRLCCVIILIIFSFPSIAMDIEPVVTLRDGTGVALVATDYDVVHAFHFGRIVMATNIVDPPDNTQLKSGVLDVVSRKFLLDNLPGNISGEGRIFLGAILRGGSFQANHKCRLFDVLTLNQKPLRRWKKTGIIWSFVDTSLTSLTVPMHGPYPETLPPASASCFIGCSDNEEYLFSVPELWPMSLQKERGARAEVPRFVRLVKDTENRYGCGDDFFVYNTLPGNPFAKDIGVNANIVSLLRTDPHTVVAISGDGRCAAYRLKDGQWTEPTALLGKERGQIIGVANSARGYIMLWRNAENILMSGKTQEFQMVKDATTEELSLADVSQLKTPLANDYLWMVGLRRRDGIVKLVVAARLIGAKEWSAWNEVASVHGESAIESVASTNQGELYAAVRNPLTSSSTIYTLFAAIDPKSGKPAISPERE